MEAPAPSAFGFAGGALRGKVAGTVRRSASAGLAAIVAALLAFPALAAGAGRSPYAYANGCYAIASAATHRFVVTGGATAYRATAPRRGAAMPFYFKPTALGIYMLQDRRGKLVSTGSGGAVVAGATPGPAAAWAASPAGARTFALRATNGAGWLTVDRTGAVRTSVAPSSGDRLRAIARNAFPFLVVAVLWETTAYLGFFPRKLFHRWKTWPPPSCG